MGHKLNYGEWGEIYVLLRTAADGSIGVAQDDETALEGHRHEVREVIRHESDMRTVIYRLPHPGDPTQEIEVIVNQDILCTVPTSLFSDKADELLSFVRRGEKAPFAVTEELDDFLAYIQVESFKAKSTDKSDIYLSVADPRSTAVREDIGYSIKTKWSQNSTLFNTGNGSRARYEVIGPLTPELIERINGLVDAKGHVDASGRLCELEAAGCELRFDSYAYSPRARCNAFEENLELINPRLVTVWQTYMLERFRRVGMGKQMPIAIPEVSAWLAEVNPCEVNRPEVVYPYMIKSFLYASYCGLTAGTLWDGRSTVNGGFITVDADGEILAFNAIEGDAFKTYLFSHCYVDFPATSEKHGNYGKLYEEDGRWFFDLNFQVRFSSR